MKQIAKRLLRRFGYDMHKYYPPRFGDNPYRDMRSLFGGNKSPIIFDVGANMGQSVYHFKQVFPDSVIHSFEPSPKTFEKLKETLSTYNKVHPWNYGVGSVPGVLPLQENNNSDMSSFLQQDRFCWGNVEKVTEVEVVTLDQFTNDHKIDFIDILKSDTQGFEFEVFKGAKRLMDENRIGLIYFEHIFSEMYKGLTPFHEILQYLSANGFSLVSFYDQHYQDEALSWTDFMFINKGYSRR